MDWHHSFLDHRRYVAAWSIRFRLNYSTDIKLWIFSYFHFSWDILLIDCLKKRESSWMYSMNIIHNKCVFFKISSAAKVAFLGVGRSSKENLSLPYSLLLDYSTLRSLSYPTLLEVEKLLLVGACRRYENFGTNAFKKSCFVSEIWPFEKKVLG